MTTMHTRKLEGAIPCRVCGIDSPFVFSGKILHYTIHYFDCQNCGYLQTENPFWLDQAYASPINATDTGLIQRNQDNAGKVATLLWLNRSTDKCLLDFAGGHGLLVRMLRDIGINAFWDDKYCKNLYARGFEHDGSAVAFVTAFEAFEHFVHPTEELAKIVKLAPTILFSTQLVPEPCPRPGEWWYYGEEHGQHVGFYRRKTLEWLASQHSATLITDNANFHAISRSPTPLKLNNASLKLASRLWPIVRRLNFKSLTWTDHETIKARMQNVDRRI